MTTGSERPASSSGHGTDGDPGACAAGEPCGGAQRMMPAAGAKSPARAANVRTYLTARIDISTPPPGAVLAGGFTVSGTAACDLLKDSPGEPGLFVRDATHNIAEVSVRVGNAAPSAATPTGTGATPWATWTFTASVPSPGPLTIVAEVFASDPPNAPDRQSVSQAVGIDLTPPTLTINPPDDVVRPAPPYVARLSGSAADGDSGVAAVEWQFGGDEFRPASGTTAWTAQVALPGLGSHTIAVRARDGVGNVSGVTQVTVRVGDNTAPALEITSPEEGETFSLSEGVVSLDLRGVASDTQSGIAGVEWSLDGQSGFAAATPRGPGDWSTWSARVQVTTAGNRTITVRATDQAMPANAVTVQRSVVVAAPYQPADPEAMFSRTAYLDDLLGFAAQRVRSAADGSLISRRHLADISRQPFVDLIQREHRAVANQPVRQIRLCIEVLRRYLAEHGRAVPADAERVYRWSAYNALLSHLGTSYDEIRLARAASAAARAALADRLAIGSAEFPDGRLNQLFLQPDDLSELALERLFGLEQTGIKPLIDSVLPEPQLLIWQKEHLRVAWQQQDDALRSAVDTPMPLIDPDWLVSGDLRTPGSGNAAFELWQARQQELNEYVAAIDAARKAQPTAQASFDRLVGDAVGPMQELMALADEHLRGNAIDTQLRSRQLSLRPFLHLMRIRQLAVTGTLLETEWEDVYAILVQVEKFRRYPAWRAQEKGKGLILAPDYFRLSDASPSEVGGVPRWRLNPQARQAWRRMLAARLQQELALTQAMETVVSAAEEVALSILRDACIATIAGERDPAVVADRLTRELGIDCREGGKQKTLRVQQAVETLQEILLSLRTGRFQGEPPVLGTSNPAADWVLALDSARYTEADFDEEWRWMGGYATWNAAIRVFAYPENHLLPELRPADAQSRAFKSLVADLRNQPRLDPLQARKLAATYHAALTDELKERLPPALRKGALLLTEQLTDTELAERRTFIRDELFRGISDPSRAPDYVQEMFYFVPMALALQLQQSGQYLTAIDWIETFYTDHLAVQERKIYRGLALEETIPTQYQRNPDNWLRVGLNPHEIATVRANAHTRFTLQTLVRCYLDFADAEFTRDDGEAIARARTLYGMARELLALPEMLTTVDNRVPVPFPPNPVPQALRMRAELNLLKLRSGRNIAGIERQSAPQAQPVVPLERVTAGGDAPRRFRPTPYRYAVLVERARNLVSIAEQVEHAFLAALEKRDAEAYNLLKAGHDLQLAGETVKLQGFRVTEAEQGVGLAERQRDRAAAQRNTYEEWIAAGLNRWESDMLEKYQKAGQVRNTLSYLDAVLATAQAAVSASSGGILGTGVGAGAAGVMLVGGLSAMRAGAAVTLNNAETAAQIDSARASFERRTQEWELQRQSAEGEVAIGEQQVVLANTHTVIARQEELISRRQHEQAQATVEFLANKFTNAELYSWMSGVLGGAYNYFLQQATAMAQLAQYQLAFERQEMAPAFIKADYWNASDERSPAPDSRGAPTDRQGLTGSVRLLQDITRLDQFAFETNRRKLQLAESFSLARLFPAEFQHFRETGRLPFATPMMLFDRGFPGHYLRLIKRVRVSMIALVPPTQGVRATLVVSGISRVVTGGDTFQTIVVRRDPELIAFTSTSNATGLLDLEPEEGMLRPFEGMGVDTSWELQLPKAANPFDFRTIADVLFSVEYTAFHDHSYRRQVIQHLDDTVSSERVFSLRDQFPDQWYALHNPGRIGSPMSVCITLTREDFPPNLSDLRISQVLLAVVRSGGRPVELGQVGLRLVPSGESMGVGGEASGTADGLISTRRGNGSAWLPLIGKSPVGTWELSLSDTEEMRGRFRNEEFEDLILVLTYEGQTPAWPE